MKCPFRWKYLVFARQPIRQGVEATWYVFGQNKNVECFAKKQVISWFPDKGIENVFPPVPGCKPPPMCCLLTTSHKSLEDVTGNEIQLEILLAFLDC
ncbi:hypothetical protein DPMN_034352 [Dreissena polymorpha]|uniref:Uncharacterized protein n=1 Tax=Dreissena polymorpha TaxID=45954 RepID=A0A9D4M7E8_DREPO|nr:hypothetical protein DPMN_034352 [Dreissena polymorpha]